MMMPNELNRASTKIALMPTKIKFWGAIAINTQRAKNHRGRSFFCPQFLMIFDDFLKILLMIFFA